MDRVTLVCLIFCANLVVQCRCDFWETNYDELSSSPESFSDDYFIPIDKIPEQSTEPTESVTEYSSTETDYLDSINTIVEDTNVQDTIDNEIQQKPAVEKNEGKPDNSEVNLLIENLSSTVSNLTTELMKQQRQLADLEQINKQLQEKIELIEQQTKTNSLIFFNVPEKEHETHKTTLTKVLYVVNKLMKVKTRAEDIAVALRTDSEDGVTYRPIVVRFVNFDTKMRVLAAKPRLQGSLVTVESDYSEGVAKERAQLVPYMMAARARGARAYILYNRLVVDGIKISLQELQQVQEQVQTVY